MNAESGKGVAIMANSDNGIAVGAFLLAERREGVRLELQISGAGRVSNASGNCLDLAGSYFLCGVWSDGWLLRRHQLPRRFLQPSFAGLPLPYLALRLPAVEFADGITCWNIFDDLPPEPSPG